jgi:hypothetical protein
VVRGELKPALFSHCRYAGDPDIWCPPSQLGLSLGALVISVTEIPQDIEAELARLQAENARLLRLLKFSPQQAAPPGPRRRHPGTTAETAPAVAPSARARGRN